MSKVLKITKPDKTVHTTPLANKAFYLSYNNRQPQEQKWKIEEIDEKDAEKLPFRDESYVTGSEAQVKVEELTKANADKDAEIERLKAELAKGPGTKAPAKTTETSAGKPAAKQYNQTGPEVIELINAAVTVEQVEALVKDDERKTVQDAATKKIASLTAA